MRQHACLELGQQAQQLCSPAAPVALLHALQGALDCAQLPCALLLDVQGSALALSACLLDRFPSHVMILKRSPNRHTP